MYATKKSHLQPASFICSGGSGPYTEFFSRKIYWGPSVIHNYSIMDQSHIHLTADKPPIFFWLASSSTIKIFMYPPNKKSMTSHYINVT